MTDYLCIRLVSLIVWHNIQRKAGLGNAVIDDFLLNIAFYALAGIRGSQSRCRSAH